MTGGSTCSIHAGFCIPNLSVRNLKLNWGTSCPCSGREPTAPRPSESPAKVESLRVLGSLASCPQLASPAACDSSSVASPTAYAESIRQPLGAPLSFALPILLARTIDTLAQPTCPASLLAASLLASSRC